MKFSRLIKISEDVELNGLFLANNYRNEAATGYTVDLDSSDELDGKTLHPTSELDGCLFSYIADRVYDVKVAVFEGPNKTFWVIDNGDYHKEWA